MIRHYAEYYHPGIIVSETSLVEVPERNPALIAQKQGSYGFRFFDRKVVIADEGEELSGARKNVSGMYYWPDCDIMDIEAARAWKGGDSILVRNMECNGYDKVVNTPFGQSFPLRDGDVVLPVSGGR
jgi:hypothetical protein